MLDLVDLSWLIGNHSPRSITNYHPFLGYSTMERGKYGECLTAKSRINMLSSLPHPKMGLNIVLFDLHSKGLPYYFEPSAKAEHVYLESLVLRAVKEIQN